MSITPTLEISFKISIKKIDCLKDRKDSFGVICFLKSSLFKDIIKYKTINILLD